MLKNEQSLVCFNDGWGLKKKTSRAFPVLFVTNAVKVQLTQIFLSSRSGMLTTTRTRKIKYNISFRFLKQELGTFNCLSKGRLGRKWVVLIGVVCFILVAGGTGNTVPPCSI